MPDTLIQVKNDNWLVGSVWKVRKSDLPTLSEAIEFWFKKLFEL